MRMHIRICAFVYFIFAIQILPLSAEVTLLPEKGSVLIRHDIGAIVGYPIFSKWRPSVTKSAVGPGWVSSLDVFLSRDGTIPIAVVQAYGQRFIFQEESAGCFRGFAQQTSSLEYTDDNYRFALRNGTVLDFSSDGSLRAVRGRTRETATVFTDAQSRITGWVTDMNQGGIIEWNKDGSVASIRCQSGWFHYNYNNGRLACISNEQGEVWEYVYDEKGKPVRVVEPGHVYTITYDSEDRVHILKDSGGEDLLVEYKEQGGASVVNVWSSGGKHTSYTFSAALTRIEEGPISGEPVTITEINLATGRKLVKKQDGTTVELSPSDNGAFVVVTHTPGRLPVRSILAPDGRLVESRTGDAVFREIAAESPESASPGAMSGQDVVVRGPRGEILKLISDGQEVAAYTYDESRRPSGITLPGGATISFEYDSDDRITQYTDAYGAVTRYQYDDQKGVLKKILPNGGVEIERYDLESRLVERQFPLGRIIRYTYEASGELPGIMLVNFDAQEWFASKNGNIAYYTSELFGNWFFRNLDGGGTKLRIAPGGRMVFYYTNRAGRITHKEDGQGKTLASYAYDAAGNLVKAENEFCALRLSQDQYGRIVSEEDRTVGLSVNYSYNATGVISAIEDSDGHTVDYILNDSKKLSEIRSSRAGVFKLKYGAFGLPVLLTRPNGVETHWMYDEGGRLEACKHVLPSGKALSAKYKYDDMGNIIEEDSSQSGRSRFSYNGLSQLARVESKRRGNIEVSYDAWGNLLCYGNRMFKYSRAGMLEQAGDAKVLCDEACRIKRIQDKEVLYEFDYDWDNRLAEVTGRNGVAGRLHYGPLGRLVLSTEQQGKSTRYTYAMERLYATKSLGSRGMRKYIFIPGMEQCIAVLKEDGSVQYPLSDSMGTITHLTDARGRIIASREFDVLGMPDGEDKLDIRLGYCGGLSFLGGNLLFLKGQHYWTPFARALAAPAVQPGTTGLREDNPLTFLGANPFNSVKQNF